MQDLTDLVRVQSGQLPIVRGRVDAAELTQTTVELLRPMAQGQPIDLSVADEPLFM